MPYTSPQFSNDLMPGNGWIPFRGDRGLEAERVK